MTDKKKLWQTKMGIFALLVIAVFILLMARLFQLQVLGGGRHSGEAEKNRMNAEKICRVEDFSLRDAGVATLGVELM
ncbi:MAG: hypothetical protein FWD39_04150 [Clostridiales bacterium]|nr:hypothetical protein [Clostridiales bacterium]